MTATGDFSLPPKAQRIFFLVRRALERQNFAAAHALLTRHAPAFPQCRGQFLHIEALLLQHEGELHKAIELLEAASVFWEHKELPVLFSLLESLRQGGEHERLLELLEEVKDLHPEQEAVLRGEYAYSRLMLGHVDEACRIFSELCDQYPTAETFAMLAEAAFNAGRYQQCLDAYQRSEELKPEDFDTFAAHAYYAHFMPHLGQQELHDLLMHCGRHCAALCPPTEPEKLRRDTSGSRPLRIGLFSDGFSLHPVGWMTYRVFELLARTGNYTFCLYNTRLGSIEDDDPVMGTFKNMAEQWLNVGHWSEDMLCQRMLDDELDMVIDMTGYTGGERVRLMARRVAPVQIKWVGGLFNTTGLANMDYLFSDRYETPDGVDHLYSEKLVRLPHSYIAYSLPYYEECRVPAPHARERKDGSITFGCFNSSHKINPVIVEVWARILREVPRSTLHIRSAHLNHKEARQRVSDLFAAQGIDEGRLTLAGRTRHVELMRRYHDIDIALDPWPFTGGLTTLEALWMGVPTITAPGPSFAGRHALSHLCNVGLEEFVAPNLDAYVPLAIAFANMPELLDQLRPLLRLRLQMSPLVDHPQRAADIHTALQAMWQRHCEGLPPIAMRFEQPTPLDDELLQAWGMAEDKDTA